MAYTPDGYDSGVGYQPPAPDGTQGSPWDPFNTKIQDAYQQYTGRQASDDELRLHHGDNPTGYSDDSFLGNALWNIRISPEARAYQERMSGGPEPTPTPTPTPPPPGPGGGGGGAVSPLPAGGGGLPGSTLPPHIAGLFTGGGQQTPVQSAYQTALLDFIGRSQETPSLSDSHLAPQVEVFRAQEQRNQERQRRAAAERAAASGTSQSGYLDQQIMQGIQDQGFNTAKFNAGLLGGEMDKRRTQLQAALQLAQATGDNEAARELQERLAQVSASMQQQGLNLQGQLGFGDLDLRRMLGMEGLNQRALEIIMGGM